MHSDSNETYSVDQLREGWSGLSDEEKVRGFCRLSIDDARDFFGALASVGQATLLRDLPDDKAAFWMRFLAPDDAADVLQVDIGEEDRDRLLALLEDPIRREVTALLAYAEDEAGGLMSPRYLRIRPGITVEVAIRYLRQQARRKPETMQYVYVLGPHQHIMGVFSFLELFTLPGDVFVEDVMQCDVITVHESTDQEEVARTMQRHGLQAVPVVDDHRCLQGIVTVDDIVDVLREEATEDIQKLGGSEALEAPYLDVRFRDMIRKRAGWLSVLFLGEMLTATAMGYFQDEIAKAVVLTMFVPLIISSGGNSGSQAATLIVRSLALGEVHLRDWFRVMYRELRSGLVLGAWLGLIGFVRVLLWQYLGIYHYGEHYMLVAVTVWASLVGVVGFGTLAGSMLPFLLRRIGFDPAASSAPFVATLVDVTGLAIYFIVAAAVLKGTLL